MKRKEEKEIESEEDSEGDNDKVETAIQGVKAEMKRLSDQMEEQNRDAKDLPTTTSRPEALHVLPPKASGLVPIKAADKAVARAHRDTKRGADYIQDVLDAMNRQREHKEGKENDSKEQRRQNPSALRVLPHKDRASGPEHTSAKSKESSQTQQRRQNAATPLHVLSHKDQALASKVTDPGYGHATDWSREKHDAGYEAPPTEDERRYTDSAVERNLGLSKNQAGDLDAFLLTMATTVFLVCGFLFVFSILRTKFPAVYAFHADHAPAKPDTNTWFGWIRHAIVQTHDAELYIGMDCAMLLELLNLYMKLLVYIGVPMVVVMCPLHGWAGGHKAGNDKLSRMGLANVQRENFQYWIHALIVWLVVGVVMSTIYKAQQNFLRRRFDWLRKMPMPRSNTVMVENIPKEYRNDAKFEDKFQQLFGEDRIQTAFVLKKTDALKHMVDKLNSDKASLAAAEYKWKKDDNDPSKRPTHRDFTGKSIDSIEYYNERVAEHKKGVEAERDKLNKAAELGDPSVFASAGFVTFRGPRDRDMAVWTQLRSDEDEFVLSVPPDPADVIYADLTSNEHKRVTKQIVGYGLIVGLIVLFIPIVGFISQLADLTKIEHSFHIVKVIITDFPFLRSILEGVLSSAALLVMMSILPTLLMLIFKHFFTLKANAWAQHRLQAWYFWFLLFFVVLVTAIGSSLAGTFEQLAESPMKIFDLLAHSLPLATHFYLNYLVLQWGTHALNLLRYVPLFKYLAFSKVWNADIAKEMAEPEDQAFYGIGSRSAQLNNAMIMTVIFCSLCPFMTVVAFINFGIARLVYGYLMIYAETRKPDLGGVFWVSALKNLQGCLLIYIMLMIGVNHRNGKPIGDSGFGPGWLTAMILPYYFYAFYRFSRLRFEQLPFEEAVEAGKKEDKQRRKATRDTYMQPELVDEF
eukprot:gnl/TRDRNA2_/TRDRNA2_175612_c0_seq1.p1 gnl/TRDRNA2_/TRDRNA2_175612_c0~~gnl/TRDRNA2_/TRDRNA2_175612_c0_seq1.p1  ORF type:complete len:976 (+),score=209.99 gnl/TRDRNA2_/TRDRNA2_175612_c0_seq1:179-2929(+)